VIVWAVLSIGCFFLAVGLHAALCRAPVLSNNVAKYVVAGTACGLALIAYLYHTEASFQNAFAAIVVYAFASELYIFLFTMITSSVSVSMIRTLRSGALSPCEVEHIYSSERMVHVRLERLQSTGLILKNTSGFVLTSRGQRMLATFERLRRFFGHAVSRT
jgi:hypothetical protein